MYITKTWSLPSDIFDDYIKVEDSSSDQVLGVKDDIIKNGSEVVLQALSDKLSADKQSWKRKTWNSIKDGYFALINPSSGKALTAEGANKITITGIFGWECINPAKGLKCNIEKSTTIN